MNDGYGMKPSNWTEANYWKAVRRLAHLKVCSFSKQPFVRIGTKTHFVYSASRVRELSRVDTVSYLADGNTTI